MAKLAKSNVEKTVIETEIIFVIKNDGKGGVVRYTKERFEKMKSSILKSGWRQATIKEIEKAGYEVKEVEADIKDETVAKVDGKESTSGDTNTGS